MELDPNLPRRDLASSHTTGRRDTRRPAVAGLPPALAAVFVATGTAAAVPAGTAKSRVVRTAILGAIPLRAFSGALLPRSVADDRGVDLGSIGGDVYPTSRKGEFWTVTDWGSNGQIKVGGEKRRTFPVPGFDPPIVKIRLTGNAVEVIDAIPLTTSSGKAVTGLSDQKAPSRCTAAPDGRRHARVGRQEIHRPTRVRNRSHTRVR